MHTERADEKTKMKRSRETIKKRSQTNKKARFQRFLFQAVWRAFFSISSFFFLIWFSLSFWIVLVLVCCFLKKGTQSKTTTKQKEKEKNNNKKEKQEGEKTKKPHKMGVLFEERARHAKKNRNRKHVFLSFSFCTSKT
jgi:predicted membrane protein